MNFIVGALLLHCSEEIAFWLFVALIEDYEMRDIYMEGLPGHIKHSTLITQLMETHLPELFEHLQDIGMNIEIFATDWYFTLFAKVIPTAQMNAFFDSFFEFGWCFFHKFTLTLLRILAPQILQMDDMAEIKQLLLLPKHKQNFYGSETSGAQSTAIQIRDLDSKSDNNELTPFSAAEPADFSPHSQPAQHQRTFLSSIGTLFGFSRGGSVGSDIDAQLHELMGTSTVSAFLKKEDAWVRMIDISKRLWGKQLPDAIIKQFLNDYEELQAQQLREQISQEARFHESDHEESVGDAELVAAESPLGMKGKAAVQGAQTQKKKQSDSPLPNGASFSSNELEDDNIEYPTSELSPMKHVHDSGMRLPKQTKLMFKNMESMRQGSHRSPTESLSRRTLTDQILKGHYGEEQSKFSKSMSNTQSLFIKQADAGS